MFKNDLTIALRNLRKYRAYSFISIAGLAMGFACCALIMLFVRDELSYDRFYPNAGRLYRVALDAALGGYYANVATPVAYLAMSRWLQDFAYRTTLSPFVFVLAGLLALAIAWLTVSYQAIKAAMTNPVECLRNE